MAVRLALASSRMARVRAAAGLDADDPLHRQHLAAREELGILVGVDVVGDDRQVDLGQSARQRASTRAVLPEPTGPATPIVYTRRDGPAYGPAGAAHVIVVVFVVLVTDTTEATRRRADRLRQGSGSEHPGIKSSLLIAEDLVGGAAGARRSPRVAIASSVGQGVRSRRGDRPAPAGRGCGRRASAGRPRRSSPGPPGEIGQHARRTAATGNGPEQPEGEAWCHGQRTRSGRVPP